ncbi:hypothetical protein HanRHA438_Chr16g0789041 [Helianthus annuus]|nr:hypothetical protein HanRHA438_Chr16g0789041 [Helianthus annuus]
MTIRLIVIRFLTSTTDRPNIIFSTTINDNKQEAKTGVVNHRQLVSSKSPPQSAHQLPNLHNYNIMNK